MHLSSASIGNQWETGKTWSPGTEGGDQYQQKTDVRTKEREEVEENDRLKEKEMKSSKQTPEHGLEGYISVH